MERPSERLILAAFLAEAVLAGGNGVSVRFSNRELDPLWGAGLRFALASLILLTVVAILRLSLPRGRAAIGALLYGALNFGAAFGLAYYALVELHAGFGQVLLAIVPLVTVLIAVSERQERLHLAGILGALLAFLGVAVMSFDALDGGLPGRYLLAALGSALCLAQAAVLVRWFPAVHPVTMNSVGMGVGALLLIVIALLLDEAIALPREPDTLLAIAYLVVIGSGVVFVLYVLVLRYWSASRVAYGFAITPVVTVLVSAWLLDEPVGVTLVAGGALVLVGVYVGVLRPTAAEAPEAAPVPEPGCP